MHRLAFHVDRAAQGPRYCPQMPQRPLEKDRAIPGLSASRRQFLSASFREYARDEPSSTVHRVKCSWSLRPLHTQRAPQLQGKAGAADCRVGRAFAPWQRRPLTWRAGRLAVRKVDSYPPMGEYPNRSDSVSEKAIPLRLARSRACRLWFQWHVRSPGGGGGGRLLRRLREGRQATMTPGGRSRSLGHRVQEVRAL